MKVIHARGKLLTDALKPGGGFPCLCAGTLSTQILPDRLSP